MKEELFVRYSSPSGYPGKHRKTITVYGSGDLGRGLMSALVKVGYRVVVASRNPLKAKQKVEALGGELAVPEIALQESRIIFLAIPFEAYEDIRKYDRYLKGKILVDVSNRPPKFDENGSSMAEQLQDLIPDAIVVKAMNTISAYALAEGTFQGSKQVPVSSDNPKAKEMVMDLVHDMGFTPVDFGDLTNSKKMEEIPLKLFPEWKAAFFTSIAIFILMWFIMLFRKQLCPNIQRDEGKPWNWEKFHALPLKATGAAAAYTSFNLLAACYFPGVIAAYIQLFRGTKYSEFPSWLSNWMRSRKQLGLLALFFAVLHGILYIAYKISDGLEVQWREQGCIALGGIAFCLMGVLGITSLPSVADTLTWREFFFLHTNLGWASLILSFIHAVLAETYDIIADKFVCVVIPHQIQVGMILPAITILLKLPLLCPCVSSYVVKLRRGYERNPPKQSVVDPAEDFIEP